MKKPIIISILIALFLIAFVFIYWWQRGDALLVQPPSDLQDGGDTLINQEDKQPTPQLELSVQDAIRVFMNDPNLTIQYITSQKNPSNFNVGRVTPIDRDIPGVVSAWRTDTPPEWKRPVYIFQQTEYINDLCEVYEYEIDARNGQLVEVHVKYPEAIQRLSLGQRKEQCSSLGSLYGPVKTEAQIKAVAMEYLSRAVPNFEQIKSKLIYKPSTENPVNIAAAHEWIWQDTSYQLPEGLTGDVYNYPTIRIIVSSSGKLIYYFNSVDLFE